jgi:hypothetical protein
MSGSHSNVVGNAEDRTNPHNGGYVDIPDNSPCPPTVFYANRGRFSGVLDNPFRPTGLWVGEKTRRQTALRAAMINAANASGDEVRNPFTLITLVHPCAPRGPFMLQALINPSSSHSAC